MKIKDVRNEIERIDSAIIELLSKRSALTGEAGKPIQTESVIRNVRKKSNESGLDPVIAEKIYRNIIYCLIQNEMTKSGAIYIEYQDI